MYIRFLVLNITLILRTNETTRQDDTKKNNIQGYTFTQKKQEKKKLKNSSQFYKYSEYQLKTAFNNTKQIFREYNILCTLIRNIYMHIFCFCYWREDIYFLHPIKSNKKTKTNKKIAYYRLFFGLLPRAYVSM